MSLDCESFVAQISLCNVIDDILKEYDRNNLSQEIPTSNGTEVAVAHQKTKFEFLKKEVQINLERTSHEELLTISKSPKLIRAYCQRQKTLVLTERRKELLRSFKFQQKKPSSPINLLTTINNNNLDRYQSDFQIPSIFKIKKNKNHNCMKREYVVEEIVSIEENRSFPVFYVKWLNYASSENTWEPLANLNDCALLMRFIANQLCKYKDAIRAICSSIHNEISAANKLCLKDAEAQILTIEKYNCIEHLADIILLAQFQLSGSKMRTLPNKIRDRVKEAAIIMPYYFLRERQLTDIVCWKEFINLSERSAAINVENNVDFDVPHKNFKYITERLPVNGIIINNEPPIGCECEIDKCNSKSSCCAKLSGSHFAYNAKNRLRIGPGMPIYECNKRCKCSLDCPNRLTQRGRKNSLCIFKTANGSGWGVKTEKVIYAGEYVCEYIGEVITAQEADFRGKKYDAEGRTYLFDLDYNEEAECVYTIDAGNYGNVSLFINHSCEPNCAVWPLWADCLDPNLPKLVFFSIRRIEAGEELSFDYISQNAIGRSENISGLEYQNLSPAEKVKCCCGTGSCRKYLF